MSVHTNFYLPCEFTSKQFFEAAKEYWRNYSLKDAKLYSEGFGEYILNLEYDDFYHFLENYYHDYYGYYSLDKNNLNRTFILDNAVVYETQKNKKNDLFRTKLLLKIYSYEQFCYIYDTMSEWFSPDLGCQDINLEKIKEFFIQNPKAIIITG